MFTLATYAKDEWMLVIRNACLPHVLAVAVVIEQQ